ncbi:MAG: hypothetical protein JNJ80_03905 [Gemmatimonadetes bacterium]|nr:hypothetical protein [Gemmatimonadota bacterium]
MLRLNNSGIGSRLGLKGDPVPCVQCDRREPGLAWGDFCTVCREERAIRANRVARRYAVVAALILAAWLLWKTPPTFTQRIFGAASVLLLYLIVRRIVSRVVQEYLPKELK